MHNRKLGNREVCAIGLGCMSLSFAYGGQPSDEEGAAILHRALELGYNHLDTARIYGAGHNETLIGQTLKGKRDQFYLASKAGINYKTSRNMKMDLRKQKKAMGGLHIW